MDKPFISKHSYVQPFSIVLLFFCLIDGGITRASHTQGSPYRKAHLSSFHIGRYVKRILVLVHDWFLVYREYLFCLAVIMLVDEVTYSI